MNRLILIGNGFDLAHGMRTGYTDFLLNYIRKAFLSVNISKPYVDGLISIAVADKPEFIYRASHPVYINDRLSWLYKNAQLGNYMAGHEISIGPNDLLERPFHTTVNFSFFQKLLSKCSQADWVDIENEFYMELKSCLNLDDLDEKKERIEELNECMSHIISQLEQYLSQLPAAVLDQRYIDIFADPIFENEVVSKQLDGPKPPKKTLLLNFNYTPTAEHYIRSKDFEKTGGTYNINHVHGRLGDSENHIIFGFGDELDEQYQQMENSQVKGFLKYIKSFWYFRTPNYHQLIRFLQADEFQIYILGHSCGLSDRTMLNMVFEHQNCKSIKIFYHGEEDHNNFVSVTEEISRHFKSKSAMRERIVPLKHSSRMPQFDDQVEHKAINYVANIIGDNCRKL